MRSLRLVLVAVIAVILPGCGSTLRELSPEFDPKPFETFSGSAILCFDVQADNGNAKAGLLLRVSQTATEGRHEIVLPFRTLSVATNRNVLLTSGRYERFTLLNFSFGTPSLGTSAIAFTPEIRPIPSGVPQVDELEPGVYFQENGNERWFAYVDGTADAITALQKDFAAVKFEAIDGIAIAIPDQAEGRDVKRGMSVVPQPATRIGNVMLFGAPANIESNRVVLRYAVPPTPAQAAAASGGLKFILIIIIPIFTLIFLDPDEVQRPRLRTIAIWTGIILQIAIAAGVTWIAFAIKKPAAEAWIDFAVAALGVVGEIVIILVKSKRKGGGAPPNEGVPQSS